MCTVNMVNYTIVINQTKPYSLLSFLFILLHCSRKLSRWFCQQYHLFLSSSFFEKPNKNFSSECCELMWVNFKIKERKKLRIYASKLNALDRSESLLSMGQRWKCNADHDQIYEIIFHVNKQINTKRILNTNENKFVPDFQFPSQCSDVDRIIYAFFQDLLKKHISLCFFLDVACCLFVCFSFYLCNYNWTTDYIQSSVIWYGAHTHTHTAYE